jgi:hypothetical protein
MRNQTYPLKGCTSDEGISKDSIFETYATIEAQLTELEQLLEIKGDARLELAQLRELRQSCKWIKALLGKVEKLPVARATASQ